MQVADEKQLLKDLIAGDITAFEDVYFKYNKKIFNFSYRFLKDKEEAKGLVQEVFLKLWENCRNLKQDSNINAWLFTVTFNALRKRFKKSRTEKNYLKKISSDNFTIPDESTDAEYNDMLEKVKCLISKLPPQQRKIFLLRNEKSLSCEEMANELKLSKKTVENHLNRARMFLRKAMVGEGLIS
jgi:RNA polymerase sigma-70 factor (family 1)